MSFNNPSFTSTEERPLSPDRRRALRILAITALGFPGCSSNLPEKTEPKSEKPEKLEELLGTYQVEFFGGHKKKLEHFNLMKITEEKYELNHPHLRAITKDRLYVDNTGKFMFTEVKLDLDEEHPEAKKLALLFPFGWQGRKLYIHQEGDLIRITKKSLQIGGRLKIPHLTVRDFFKAL